MNYKATTIFPAWNCPKEEAHIGVWGSVLSFLMFFIELVLFSSQYLIFRGGGVYTLPRYDIFGRKGIFELEHIKESREDEGNHRCMPWLLCWKRTDAACENEGMIRTTTIIPKNKNKTQEALMRKRILPFIMVVLMIFTALPISASASTLYYGKINQFRWNIYRCLIWNVVLVWKWNFYKQRNG